MKTLFVLSSLFSLFVASVSNADYNSDVPGSEIACDNGGDVAVSISKDRRTITVITDGDQVVYNVVNAQNPATDGDTFRTYVGLHGSGRNADKAVLSFDDQGDSLKLNTQTFAVECQ